MGLGLVENFFGGVVVTGALTALWMFVLGRVMRGAALRFIFANVLSVVTVMLVWSVVGPSQIPRFRGSFASAAFEWAIFPQIVILVAGMMCAMMAMSRVAMEEAQRAPPPPTVTFTPANPLIEPIRPPPTVPRVYRFNNVFARHWRGELKIWTSFWAVGIFMSVAINAVLLVLLESFPLQTTIHPVALFALLAAVWTFSLGALLWQWVGVWRSASRYSAERRSRGLRAVWGVASKVVVVLVLLQTIATVATQAVPQITEMTKIAFMGDPDISPFAVRAMRGGREIEVTGGFKYGLNLALLEVLARTPDAEIVHFTSEGGRVAEAREVFQTIRSHRLSTYVSNFCASACTFAFAAGTQRWAGSGAEFGFHSPSAPGYTEGDIAASRAEVLELFADTGINEGFIRRGLAVDPDDIWIPETVMLLRSRYITGEAETDQFASSGWGYEEGFGADMTALDFAEISTWRYDWLEKLEGFRPALYERVGAEGLAAYLDGATPSEVRRSMGVAAGRAAQDIQHLAGADTIRNIAVRLVYEYRLLRDRDPAQCYAYATGLPEATFDQLFTGDTLQSHFSYARAIVETARDRELDPALPRYQAAFATRVANVLDARSRALLDAAEIAPAEQAAYCDALIAYFRQLLDMPFDQSVALLRDILETRWRLR